MQPISKMNDSKNCTTKGLTLTNNEKSADLDYVDSYVFDHTTIGDTIKNSTSNNFAGILISSSESNLSNEESNNKCIEQPNPTHCNSLNKKSEFTRIAAPTVNFSSENDITASCMVEDDSICGGNGFAQPYIRSDTYEPVVIVSNTCSETNLLAFKVKRFQKRLSLTGLTSGSIPSVHGRAISTNGNEIKKTRLSTHQRNHSLDFRSMGILLPPISQVTNNRINLKQHHRNRSLDSALQRIPEVEVSSPNAENENKFCTTSIIGNAIGSKKISSSTNPNIKPTVSADTHIKGFCSTKNIKSNIETEHVLNVNQNENKKKECFTSLGSDDSGIICGSESDQSSLMHLRRSHESLDSGKNDPEEECIDIIDLTEINDKCHTHLEVNSCQTNEEINNENKLILNVEKDEEDETMQFKNADVIRLPTNNNQTICVSTDSENDSTNDTLLANNIIHSSKLDVANKQQKPDSEFKQEYIKNEVIFKSIFGATKNAIFRTAQSIIDNHEKKNSVKTKIDKIDKEEIHIKSPTEILKKKDFFTLRQSSNKCKVSIARSQNKIQENLSKNLPQSNTLSLTNLTNNTGKVPGVVRCFTKTKSTEPLQLRTKNSHSGLLRFFESPIFNIHFALHYLFYSKEPGVLSFIGNKIFSFKNNDVDLYIPQLVLMYIQMYELAEVLDPYLVYRCRKAADFSLKCCWLLEAYNYNADSFNLNNFSNKPQLSLMTELYPKRERKQLQNTACFKDNVIISPIKKTHHRSQSDATGLLNGSLTLNTKLYQTPVRLCLGDLSTGRAFDNGCTCFDSVRGTVNDLLGHKTVCTCGAPKLAPQKEFMKSLIEIGKNLTPLPTKTEKTSILRMRLNLINKNLPARVWLPLNTDIPHHVVRITEEKTAVLNSKDKTPYIIYVEVVEVNDIYTSPVIPKLMQSLRHTKSEEHLDTNAANVTKSINTNNKTLVQQNSVDNNVKILIENTSENVTTNIDIVSKDYNKSITEDDVWSQEDDEITSQYLRLRKLCDRDSLSQMSLDSIDSREQNLQSLFNIGDVRTRHYKNLHSENTKPFRNDPEDPSAAALKEPWHEKERQIRESSPYGHLPNWRLLSAIVKCGDDLRQELMATQLLETFKLIWIEENVDVWVCPYKIVCFSNDSGLIEPILNTVSLHQIKKNSNRALRDYFIDEYGTPDDGHFQVAQRNFMQSCAAYCLISYLLQVKDRHNGNILLHSDGHLIHIDFGFILNISPKNLGFEQSPFKLTPEFVEVMGGPDSALWCEFQHLLLKGLMAARKHMDRVINLVEIMRSSAQLPCFKNGCAGTIRNLRNRFHMNLTEQELERKIEQLIQHSLNSLSTKLYDGYQYLTNGIL